MINHFLLAAVSILSVILFINTKKFINLKNPVTAITIIVLLGAVALLLNAEYIQPIGFCVGIMSLVPVILF